ncbi:DUF2141 domain-containing protein [Stakelama flava]|uniref:DUF2141 domain-containing protein n=1 Tax=Stakelama flava TaxID=2860338 RepID=UPI0031BA10B6
MALIVVAALTGAAAPSAPSPLTVRIDNLRSQKGQVLLCLTASAAHFPDCADDPNAIRRSVPAAQHVIRFDALAPGTYAVSVIHDENGNSRLDTFAGIPREGFGFSRNPAVHFGPPRFAAVRFVLGADTANQDIKIQYIL